jgi:7-keto-8-aminopelargonate synthetase-like enzyme
VQRIRTEIEETQTAGLYKTERVISSAQGPEITVNGKTVLNFCANNYLGLSSHPKTIEAVKRYIDSHGYGMSRCGLSAARRTFIKNWSKSWRVPRHRRHHLVSCGVRRQRRRV